MSDPTEAVARALLRTVLDAFASALSAFGHGAPLVSLKRSPGLQPSTAVIPVWSAGVASGAFARDPTTMIASTTMIAAIEIQRFLLLVRLEPVLLLFLLSIPAV